MSHASNPAPDDPVLYDDVTPPRHDLGPVGHPVRRWVVLFCVVVALVAASVGGLAWVSSAQQWSVPAASSTVAPTVFGSSASPSSPSSAPVAPDPSKQCLAQALGAVQYGGNGVVSGEVRGMSSGTVLWALNPDALHLPASSEKLLTTLSLVDALGPNALGTTYATSVVSGGDNRIVLVGGGDSYLASTKDTATLGQPATLEDLAAATASALKAQGQTSVSLGFDDTAFSGPDWLSSWTSDDASEVTRVSALWVDEGHTLINGKLSSAATATPALDAAHLFAKQLQADGIKVTSVDGAGAAAPKGATTIASIESMPLGDIIARTLLVSDNSSAEVLLRHLAIANGQPGSFEAGAAAVMAWVDSKSLSVSGLHIADGSGLSRANAVPASALVGALTWAGQQDGPAREVLTRLPVAFVSGTLLSRFQAANAAAARGWVHAKTGSLTGVATLSGYTVTTQGQVLAFSFMVNNETQSGAAMRTWIDQMAATLTGTKC